MRPKSMILIVIALGCGLVASIGISQVIEKRSQTGGTAKTGQVFVTLVDVPIRETLTAQMVKLEDWPLDKIPEGAVTRLEDITGMKPMQPLYEGEVILNRKIVDPKSALAAPSEKIRDGYRVFPVKVTEDSIASGLVLPGDRVDVLVYLSRDVVSPVTKTILTDVTVFAVNEHIERRNDGEQNTIAAKTVSLLVKPKQVERLMLAKEMGKLSLSLRGANDETNNETGDGASVHELNLVEDAALEKATPSTGRGLGSNLFLDYLNTSAQPAAALADGRERFTMEIHTPAGVEFFSWDDRNKLPLELRQDDVETGTPAPELDTAEESDSSSGGHLDGISTFEGQNSSTVIAGDGPRDDA